MTNKLLSELAKGSWSSLTAYTIGDIVDNDGSSYICIANSTNNEPPNASYWALLADKGDQGDTGDTGSQGDTGVQGDTGIQGDTGADSTVAGDTGTQGDTGVQGDTGITGNTGDTGIQGNQGDTGSQGDTGVQGDTGAQGEAAMPGTSMIGELYVADNTTPQELTLQDTWYKWTTGWNEGSYNGIVFDAVNGTMTVGETVGVRGSLTGSLTADSNNQTIEIALFVNDVYDPEASGHVTVRVSGAYYTFAIAGIAELTVGDVLDVRVKNQSSAGKNITFQEIQFNLSAVAGSQGDTGVQGDTGTQGDQGDTGSQGDQGDTGVQGDTGTPGAGVNWLGDWNSGTTYSQYDAVGYNGTSYISSQDSNTNQNPETETAYWDVWVEKGDTGSQGDTGTQGDTGVQGDQGDTGTQGIQGDTGTQGDTGVQGNQGDTGVQGDTGSQGDTGVQGDTGAIANEWNPDSTPDSDTTASGITMNYIANENQAFGDMCYINADNEMQIGDAGAIATSGVVAMCMETVLANNSAKYLFFGVARNDAWNWTVGGSNGLIYLSTTGTTGNTLTQTAPSGTDEVVQILGVATHTDRMLVNPQLVQVEHV